MTGEKGIAFGQLLRYDSIEEARRWFEVGTSFFDLSEDLEILEDTEDRKIVRGAVSDFLGVPGWYREDYYGQIRHENCVIFVHVGSCGRTAPVECVFNALVKDLTALADSKGVPPSSLPPPSGGQAAAAGAAAAAAAVWAILNGLSNAGGSSISRGGRGTGGEGTGGGGTGSGTPRPGGIPEWVDPEYEQEQMEWWLQGIEDEKMRLESYMRHRKDDPGFDERVKDMQRSIDYYQEKMGEQQARMQQWGITPGEHRPVNQWDAFKVDDWELEVHEEPARRQRWNEAWEKFEKMREGAEKREHWLYSDPEKWDRAMDNIFKDDGEVDYDALNRARTVFKRAIDADIDTMAPEHRHWVDEATIQTVKDAKNNPVVRILAAKLSGGTSELFFEPLDQLEKMHDYVKYHDRGGSDLEAVAGAFKYGVEELAKDKLAVREIRTLATGKVEMPDGTTRDATTLDSTISLLSLGMKGKDFYSTTVGGEFWDSKAFGIDTNRVRDKGSEMFDNLMGKRQGSSVPGTEGASIRGMDEGVDTRPPGVEAEGGGPIGTGEGSPKQPKIPSEFADDYKAMCRALANGDEAAANRHATRMLVKDYEEFQKMARNSTIDSDTAKRAVRTHQQIVREGVAEGMNRTKKMGDLLQEEVHIDADGNMTVHKPVKHAWAPGSAMEDFDTIKRVPGDTDVTPVVDRNVCNARGIDPDDLMKKTSGHMRDGINDTARKYLGDDVGDYCKKTKVKTFEPGSAEEYHSSFYHEEIKGNVIDADGNVPKNKTTLGEEMWPGTKREINNALTNSKTGRAMVAADEHFQISKNIREHNDAIIRLRNDSNLSKAELDSKIQSRNVETARELAKHHGRMEKGANWKADDVDTGRLQIDESTASSEKLRKFQETLEGV